MRAGAGNHATESHLGMISPSSTHVFHCDPVLLLPDLFSWTVLIDFLLAARTVD
jgi:hypothetical protein